MKKRLLHVLGLIGFIFVSNAQELIIGEERIEPGIIFIFDGAIKDNVSPNSFHLEEKQTNVHIEVRVNWDTQNIIFTPNEQVRFIDVKYSEHGIYGDPNYDYAKIYQSLCGYDEILLDKYVVESYRKKMKNYFESKFTPNELNNIKLITSSLLFSLIPLHDNDKCIQYFELSKELL